MPRSHATTSGTAQKSDPRRSGERYRSYPRRQRRRTGTSGQLGHRVGGRCHRLLELRLRIHDSHPSELRAGRCHSCSAFPGKTFRDTPPQLSSPTLDPTSPAHPPLTRISKCQAATARRSRQRHPEQSRSHRYRPESVRAPPRRPRTNTPARNQRSHLRGYIGQRNRPHAHRRCSPTKPEHCSGSSNRTRTGLTHRNATAAAGPALAHTRPVPSSCPL